MMKSPKVLIWTTYLKHTMRFGSLFKAIGFMHQIIFYIKQTLILDI